jgi:hypothetical protein
LVGLLGVLTGCTFPEVTFSDGSPDDGGHVTPGLDADVPDAGLSFGDDAAAPADSSEPPGDASGLDRASDAPPSGDAGCDFNGTWATRITIDVTWQPQGLTSVILQSGSGTITQWVKGLRVQNPAAPLALMDESVVCGIALPDFQATTLGLNEVYGVRFPDSLFDDGYVPPFTVSGVLNAAMTGYTTTSTAVLLGLTMASPTTDPWPSIVMTEDDMDNDGNPGVTVNVAQGPIANPTGTATTYSYIPTDVPPPFVPTPEASNLYVAIRQVTVTTGTVVDCNTISGTVSIPVIASKPAIDSHILGCALVDGGQCTTGDSSQASFVDNSQPVFTSSGSTSFQSIRVSSQATCADVRSAFH